MAVARTMKEVTPLMRQKQAATMPQAVPMVPSQMGPPILVIIMLAGTCMEASAGNTGPAWHSRSAQHSYADCRVMCDAIMLYRLVAVACSPLPRHASACCCSQLLCACWCLTENTYMWQKTVLHGKQQQQ